jgi:hypothetical protein
VQLFWADQSFHWSERRKWWKKKETTARRKKTWIPCKASHCSSLESLPHESVASCLRLLYFANCPKLIEAVWIRQKVHYPHGLKINLANSEGCNSIGQVLDLLFGGYQFECHKSQGYWRLTWSLISEPWGLVDVRVNWPEHPQLPKINK